MKITKKILIDFETEIFDNYSEGKIRAPVHLTGSVDGHQEDMLIKIFKKVKPEDWVFSTHRSHYHAILKSKNPEWVKSEIFAKRSSHINSEYYKIFTSAIVGGCLSIALGTALSIKRRKGKEHVWCFIGDMASKMGIAHECARYCRFRKLPITFIIENNGLGVYTNTRKVWGLKQRKPDEGLYKHSDFMYEYCYERKYPHYGVGKWVTF